jgi:glucan endo-1,6-beta-glucosidase
LLTFVAVDFQYAKTLVNSTKDVIKGIAWNCYSGDGPAKWLALLKMDNYVHGLPEQYMTECWTAKGKTSWKHTLDYILLPLAKRISGVMVGALATYPHGGPVPPGDDECFTCTGVITVDPSNGTYTKEVDYYMLGMFSRYIPTRDARLAEMRHSKLLEDGSGIRAIATVNFGEGGETRTVVIQSRFEKDVWVKVIAEGDKRSWNGRAVANGVTTWVLPPAAKKRPR